MQQINKRQHGGQQPAHKLHQPGADQVAHAFHVGHDARHQRAGAVLIIVGHGEQAHVLLHLPAHFGNQPLAGFREQLGEGERRDGLHHHGRKNQRNDAGQPLRMRVHRRKHRVKQRLAGVGQNQSGHAVDGHQTQSENEQPFPRRHQRPHLRPQLLQVGLALGHIRLPRARSAPMRRVLGAYAHAHPSTMHGAHALNPS